MEERKLNNFWDWNSFFIFISVYFISILIISKIRICNNCAINKKYRMRKTQIFIALLPALLLLAFRSENTGQDLMTYKLEYFNMQNINFSVSWLLYHFSKREPIYLIIETLTGVISNWNFQVLIVITSLFQFVFMYKVFCKQKMRDINIVVPFAFFLCFVYIRSFSMIRQAMAMSVMLYAYTFLEERKYSKYWLYSFVAIGIHYTAFISILVYFWAKEDKLKIFKRISMIVIFVLTFVFGEMIFTNVFNIFGSKYALMNFNAEFGVGNLIVGLPPLIFLIWKRKELKKAFPSIGVYINIYYLDIIISQFKYYNVKFERLTMYTSMALLFILPVWYKVLRKKYGILINVLFFIVFISWFIYKLYYYTYISPYSIMPYEFFWQN